jgi:hypothetical protein
MCRKYAESCRDEAWYATDDHSERVEDPDVTRIAGKPLSQARLIDINGAVGIFRWMANEMTRSAFGY